MLCARAALMKGSGCAADPPAREKFLKFCKSAIDIPTKTRYTIKAVRNAAQGPVAQLDRVFDYESKGRGFESRRAHQRNPQTITVCGFSLSIFPFSMSPVFSYSAPFEVQNEVQTFPPKMSACIVLSLAVAAACYSPSVSVSSSMTI